MSNTSDRLRSKYGIDTNSTTSSSTNSNIKQTETTSSDTSNRLRSRYGISSPGVTTNKTTVSPTVSNTSNTDITTPTKTYKAPSTVSEYRTISSDYVDGRTQALSEIYTASQTGDTADIHAEGRAYRNLSRQGMSDAEINQQAKEFGANASKPSGFNTNFNPSGSKISTTDIINALAGTNVKDIDYLNESEKNTLYYLYNTQGRQQAENYYNSIIGGVNKRDYENEVKEISNDYNKMGTVGRIAMGTAITGMSAPMKFAGGVMSSTKDIYDLATGKEIDPYGALNYSNNLSQDMRNMVGDRIEQDTNAQIMGKNVARQLYDIINSTIDSKVGGIAFGAPYTVYMGINAFTNEMEEAVKQGKTQEEALPKAVVAGAAETLSELISLELLLSPKSYGNVGGLVKEFGKLFLSEGSEEVSSEAFQTVMNKVIDKLNFEKTDAQKDIQEMVDSGMSQKDASKEYYKNRIYDYAWAFLSGGMSGLLGGSAYQGAQAINQYQTGKAMKNRGSDLQFVETVQRDFANNENSESKKYADMYAKRMAEGKSVSSLGLGNLEYISVQEALKDGKSKVTYDDVYKKVVETRNKLGMANIDEEARKTLDTDTENVAKVITNIINGKNVSRKDYDNAMSYKFAQDTLQGLQNERTFKEFISANKASNLIQTAEENQFENRKLGDEDRFNITNAKVLYDGKEMHIDGGKSRFNAIVDVDGSNAIKLANGKTVKLSDLEFADSNSAEATLYRQASKMPTNVANTMIDQYDGQDIDEYIRATEGLIALGKVGATGRQIINSGIDFGSFYNQKSANRILQAGLESREFKQGLTNLSTNRDLNEKYKGQIEIVNRIAKETGMEIFLFDSLGENGANEYNGAYVGKNRIIMSLDAEGGLLLRTLGHEQGHFLKRYNADGFKMLSDMVVKALEKKDKKTSDLLKKYGNKNYEGDEAKFEELICDSLYKVYDNEFVAELYDRDEGVAKNLGETLDSFINAYERAIKNLELSGKKPEIEALNNDYETLKDIQALFKKQLTVARTNYVQSSDFRKSMADISKVMSGESDVATNKDGSVIALSSITYQRSGRDALIRTLKERGHTQEEIDAAVSFMDNAQNFLKDVAENNSYLADKFNSDYYVDPITGNAVFSSLVKNDEYTVNFDLSTICKKRVAYQRVIDHLLETGKFDQLVYNDECVGIVNEILRNAGFETACAACFVESRRMFMQSWAEKFTSIWNENVAKYKPDAKHIKDITEEDVQAIIKAKSKFTLNDKGNIKTNKAFMDGIENNVENRTKKLIQKVPELAFYIDNNDVLDTTAAFKLQSRVGDIWSQFKQSRGASTPKASLPFNAYNSDVANLTFKYVAKMVDANTKGSSTYITQAANKLGLKKSDYNITSKTDDTTWRDNDNLDQQKVRNYFNVQHLAMQMYLSDIGGARMQSFSDFIIEEVFDKMQLYADMAAQGFPMHEYTKEISCARIFGTLGSKINGSVIHLVDKSLDKKYAGLQKKYVNGEVRYYYQAGDYEHSVNYNTPIQSIGWKDAIALMMDTRYSSNFGTIAIGFSDAHIDMMLDDPLIRMVIPYHKSGLPEIFAQISGMKFGTDYTNYQSTRNADGNKIKDDGFGWNKWARKIGAREAAQKYLEYCDKKGYEPKFSKWRDHPNYYKLLTDFNAYDCVTEASAPQGAIEIIDKVTGITKYAQKNGLKDIEEYKQRLRNAKTMYMTEDGVIHTDGEAIFTEKEIDKYVEKAQRDYQQIIKDELDSQKRIKDIQEPKFKQALKDIDEVLFKYADRKRLGIEGPIISKAKVPSFYDIAMNEMGLSSMYGNKLSLSTKDVEYSELAKNPEQNKVELREIVESEARRNGYDSPILYHGTDHFGFTKLKTSNVEDGHEWSPFFLANNSEISGTYTIADVVRGASSKLSENEINELVKRKQSDLDNAINRFFSLVGENFGEESVGQGVRINLKKRIEKSSPYNSYDVLSDFIIETFQNYADYDIDFYGYTNGEDWLKRSESGEEIRDTIVSVWISKENAHDLKEYGANGGIYQFYANTDNMFEVDAKGKHWNELNPDGLPKLSKYGNDDVPYNTRDVSLWAKENGYDGVIFKNIIDIGEKGETAPVGDVYAFFNPQYQVKSADLVTYDDKGKVIPLSKRFNSNNDDIRFSTKDVPGQITLFGEQEFFGYDYGDENVEEKPKSVETPGIRDAYKNVLDRWINGDIRRIRTGVQGRYYYSTENEKYKVFDLPSRALSEDVSADIIALAESCHNVRQCSELIELYELLSIDYIADERRGDMSEDDLKIRLKTVSEIKSALSQQRNNIKYNLLPLNELWIMRNSENDNEFKNMKYWELVGYVVGNYEEYAFMRNYNKTKKEFSKFLKSTNDIEFLKFMENVIIRDATQRGTYSKQIAANIKAQFTKRINVIESQKLEEGASGRVIKIDETPKTSEEIKELFDSLNSDESLSKLADKVFETTSKLGVRFKFDDGFSYTKGKGGKLGVASGMRARYVKKYFADPTATDQSKAETLLHEAIHNCTVYVLRANENPAFLRYYSLSPEMFECAKIINNAYEQCKEMWRKGDADFDGEFSGHVYGLTNVREFAAEFSDSSFRDTLKKKGLWQRIVDAIKKMFGISAKTESQLDVQQALEYIIDNYDYDAANQYDRLARKETDTWNFSTKDISETDYFFENNISYTQELEAIVHQTRRILDIVTEDLDVLHVEQDSTKPIVKTFLAEFNEKVSKELSEEANKELYNIYEYLAMHNRDYDAEEALKYLTTYARHYIETSETIDTEEYDATSDMRKYLHDKGVKVSAEEMKMIIAECGGWKDVVRQFWGKIKMVRTNDTRYLSIDEAYKELAGMLPGYLEDETVKSNLVDQLFAMVELLEKTGKKVLHQYGSGSAYTMGRRDYNKSFYEGYAREDLDRQSAIWGAKLLKEYTDIIKKPFDKKYELYKHRLGEEYNRKLKAEKERLDIEYSEAKMSLDRAAKRYYLRILEDADKTAREKFEEYKKSYNDNQDRIKSRKRADDNIERNLKYLYRCYTDRSKSKHIPYGYEELVKSLLESVPGTGNTSRRDIISKQSMETTFNLWREKLYDMYAEDNEDANALESDVAYLIESLRDGGGARRRNLSVNDMVTLSNFIANIRHLVEKENKLFGENQKEKIDEIQKGIARDFQFEKKSIYQKGSENKKAERLDFQDEFRAGLTKPEYLFKNSGSKTLYEKAYLPMRYGENTEGRILYDGKVMLSTLKAKHDYNPAWEDRYITFKHNGSDISISIERAMYMYALNRRAQGRQHLVGDQAMNIVGGGITYIDAVTGHKASTKLTPDDVNEVISKLPKNAIAYVDDVMKYLSTDLGKERNVISMDLMGFEKYTEEVYVPIQVDKGSIKQDSNRGEKLTSLANQGASRTLVKGAKNPILLDGFDTIVNKHIYESALYCGYAVPTENFNRIWNAKYNDDKLVHDLVEDYCGKNVARYMQKFTTDVNSGQLTIDQMAMSARMMTRAKKAATMANISVIVQQPTAVFRAMLYINPKYFDVNSIPTKEDLEEMYRYNGCALKKDIGYFDVNVGKSATDWLNEYDPSQSVKDNWSNAEKWKQFDVKGTVEELAGWGANKADEITWGAIWNACKKQVKDNGSTNIIEDASKLFQDTIVKTQVYDSVFTKCEYMRRKEGFAQMATAFMSEPITSLNMLADAVHSKNRGMIGKAFACYAASLVTNSALKSVIQTFRDDDEEKDWLVKYLTNFVSNIVNDIFGMIPYINTIVNVIQGYESTKLDTQFISTMYNALKSTRKLIQNDDIEWEDVRKTLFKDINAISQLSGVPVYNVVRDVMTATEKLYKTITDFDNVEFAWDDLMESLKEEFKPK